MRARWLKPDFFTDKKIATLTAESALVFEALWCWADDGGVCICDPDYLKSQVFFRWDLFTPDVIGKALKDLFDLKVILVYKIGDDHFASIRHWPRHQNVHKPSKFRHPRPDEQLSFSNAVFPLDIPGTPPAPLPASPPSRQLDGYIARQLDGDVPEALARNPPGTIDQKHDVDHSSNGDDPVRSVPYQSLRRLLETDPDRDALDAIVRLAPDPGSWVAEARVGLDGMHAPPMSPRQLGEALRDYVGNGNLNPPRSPNFKHFRRYLENAAKSPPKGDSGPMNSVDPAKPRSPDPGEAGAILARLKSHGETDQPDHVRQAVRASGGLDAIRAVRPERFGYLLRDFTVALDFARRNPEVMPEPKPFEPPPVVESDRMRQAREREEAWLSDHPGETLPADFHFKRRNGDG